MVLSKEHKYVYIAIPKTASKSIEKFLVDNYNGVRHGSHHSYAIPNKAINYFKFSCVRNPYVRMVSMWYSVTQRVPEEYGLDNFEDLSFDGFVKGITTGVKGTRDFFYLKQTDFTLKINRVLWYEDLPGNLLQFPFITSVNNFPHLNSTQVEENYNPIKRKPWKEYLTQESLERINQYYFLDFLSFNYQVCTSIKELDNYEERPWQFKS